MFDYLGKPYPSRETWEGTRSLGSSQPQLGYKGVSCDHLKGEASLKSYKSRGGAGTSTETLRGGVGLVNPQTAGLLRRASDSSLRISRSRSSSTTFLPRQFGQVMNPLPSLQSWH
jgi:hypothetical protein